MTMRLLVVLTLLTAGAAAQVAPDRLLNAAREPQNWLTYSGGYLSQRHTALDQVTPANVRNLELRWVFQAQSLEKFAVSPLVVDGIMYVTQANNSVVALDAKAGRVFWVYQHTLPPDVKLCCGSVNRGLAILGDVLFMGTLDSQLVALDTRTGRPLWKTVVADYKAGYSLTLAPLVIKDKVLVGTAGGEFGIRGFVAAYDARTGKEAWRFNAVPSPGEPGHETWKNDAWKTGGGSAWLTGSYDPELNLTYWGIGNPGPDMNIAQRPGDNLYTDSLVALDADTGAMKWYFQFTPNDGADWDAVQVPVLVNGTWNGSPRKLLYSANRNGFFYVFDRANGQFLLGRPFVKQNWSKGLDDNGRPILAALAPNEPVYPGMQGGTNWYSPSYSPRTGLFYVSAWENYGSIYRKEPVEYEAGRRFNGGAGATMKTVPDAPVMPGPQAPRSPINTWTNLVGNGAVIAIDPKTGKQRWRFPTTDVSSSGILTTAADLLFTGSREGYFYALDARTGAQLWRASLGGQGANAPMSYSVNGSQHVAVASGNSLFVFGLR
jgi:alcohol dehydrogenase (cytochrome c)